MQTTAGDVLERLRARLLEDNAEEPINTRRAKILRAFIGAGAADQSCVCLLWLLERRDNESILTLWTSIAAPGEDTNWTESYPGEIRLGRWADSAAIVASVAVLGDEPRFTVADYVQSRLSGPARVEKLIPLCDFDEGRDGLSGVIQIVTAAEETAAISPETEGYISLIFSMWLSNERKMRVLQTLKDIQALSVGEENSVELATRVKAILLEMTSATHADIFIVDRGNSLRRWDGNKVNETDCLGIDSFTSRLMFHGDPRGETRRYTDIFSSDERCLSGLDYPELTDADLPPGLSGGGPVGWLSATAGAASTIPDTPVPFVMLRLLTRTAPGNLGGWFSKTQERRVEAVARFLADVLPGLQRWERMKEISQHLTNVRDTYRARVARVSFLGRELEYCRVLEKYVPAVARAIVVTSSFSQHTVSQGFAGAADNFGPTESLGPVRPPFAWTTKPPQIENPRDAIGKPARDDLLDIAIQNPAPHRTGLRIALNRYPVATYEMDLIRFVASELKLAAVNDMDMNDKVVQIAEIRHHLRAFLTGVIHHVSALSSSYKDAEALFRSGDEASATRILLGQAAFRKSVERARLSSEQMHILFEDTRMLLADITQASLQFSRVDIVEMVREMATIFLPEASRRRVSINVEDNSQSADAILVADRSLVQLTLFNLVDNAVKYSFKGNHVGIVVKVDRGNWRVSIENIGRHIPISAQSDIFEAFQRVAPEKGVQEMPGTGIGLAASRRVARLHGGDIRVQSFLEDSRGGSARARTIFTLELPRTRPRGN